MSAPVGSADLRYRFEGDVSPISTDDIGPSTALHLVSKISNGPAAREITSTMLGVYPMAFLRKVRNAATKDMGKPTKLFPKPG